MIDINALFEWGEKYIVRTFPEEGVEFNGEKYLTSKKHYNKLLSCGILFVADKRIGYDNPFIHLSLAGQILQQYVILEAQFNKRWDDLQKDMHKVVQKQVCLMLKDLANDLEVE